MKVGFATINNPTIDITHQLERLNALGCNKIFQGQHMGLLQEDEFRREQLINYIVDGDTVVVNALTDLGHSLKAVVERINSIHEKGANLLTLDETIDTSYDSEYTRAIIATSKMFAQLDQSLVKVRTALGRANAKLNGKKLGRTPALSDSQQQAVMAALENKQTVSSLAREYQVSRTTIQRIRTKHQKVIINQ